MRSPALALACDINTLLASQHLFLRMPEDFDAAQLMSRFSCRDGTQGVLTSELHHGLPTWAMRTPYVLVDWQHTVQHGRSLFVWLIHSQRVNTQLFAGQYGKLKGCLCLPAARTITKAHSCPTETPLLRLNAQSLLQFVLCLTGTWRQQQNNNLVCMT